MHQIKFCFFERSDDEEKTITKLPLPFHLHNYSILASIHPNENPKTILVTYLIMEVCNLETNVCLKWVHDSYTDLLIRCDVVFMVSKTMKLIF